MANSVLQLAFVRGWPAYGRNMATSMPAPLSCCFGVFLAAFAVQPCGAMHGRAPERCTVATQVAGAPEPEAAVEAFLLARRWLDLDELPTPSDPASQLELPGVTGVCIVLRQDGRLVGIGEDISAGPLMLRRAVGRAVSKALADDTVRSVRGVTGDKVTARLSLELELAGARIPLIGRTIGDAADRIVPGGEGIALQRADAVSMAFPSRLLATDSAARPDSTITALMVEAGLPAKDLPEFATEERVSLLRFASIRLRQDGAGGTPAIVTRAGRVIDLTEVTPAFTRGLAIRLAARLAAHVAPVDPDDATRGVRLLGTYNPTADRHVPPFADARESALAAFALAEAAACERLPEQVRRVAREKAIALAEGLQRLPEAARATPVDELCAIALVRAGSGDRVPLDPLRKRIADRLAEPGDGSVAGSSMLVAAALALGVPGDGSAIADRARRIADAVGANPAAALDAALPVALLARGAGLDPATAATLRTALASAATALRAQQLGADDSLGPAPADLVGGIAPPGAPRLRADTASLRFSAGFAIGLLGQAGAGDPVAPPIAALQRGTVRFLAQHTADDPWVGGFRRPDSLRGLVRRSLAGDDCPPEATALGLLVALGGLGGS
ncbi:MAG: hypothetical protein RL325_1164 [Planctomycetota bacterium]